MALHAGTLMFKGFFDLDPTIGLLVILGLTSIYTLVGGLRAVVHTEVAQVVILLVGATIVAYSSFSELQAQGILTVEQLRYNTTDETGLDHVSVRSFAVLLS